MLLVVLLFAALHVACCSGVAKCLDLLRAYCSHKLTVYSQVTLKALRGTNMIEQ